MPAALRVRVSLASQTREESSPPVHCRLGCMRVSLRAPTAKEGTTVSFQREEVSPHGSPKQGGDALLFLVSCVPPRYFPLQGKPTSPLGSKLFFTSSLEAAVVRDHRPMAGADAGDLSAVGWWRRLENVEGDGRILFCGSLENFEVIRENARRAWRKKTGLSRVQVKTFCAQSRTKASSLTSSVYQAR